MSCKMTLWHWREPVPFLIEIDIFGAEDIAKAAALLKEQVKEVIEG